MKILKTWTFKWWEVGLLKICLLSLGILLTLYFNNYLANFLLLWWILFVTTAVYFVVRFVGRK